MMDRSRGGIHFFLRGRNRCAFYYGLPCPPPVFSGDDSVFFLYFISPCIYMNMMIMAATLTLLA